MVYSIIPARGGSKGIPGKNLKQLHGHPLIAYSIRASILSKHTSRTIVSTDSSEIAEIARHYGAEVPFLRPAAISGDRSTDYEFVAHALDWFKDNEGKLPEFLVHLRPTTPLREPELIDQAIEKFRTSPPSTALRSVHQMPESAYKSFEIHEEWLKAVGSGSFELDASNSARQAFPPTFYGNGYVDVLRASFVLEHERIHGNKVYGFVTSKVVEVDTLEEFELLEFQIHKDKTIFQKLFG
ncbi:MAG: acylneuraminate cytidylyltransferase family protein [Bdellovibrionota bacterium]